MSKIVVPLFLFSFYFNSWFLYFTSNIFDEKSSYFSDKILDGKGDEDECGSKQLIEGNDKTDGNSDNKTCEEDNLVVTRKPSGNIFA